MLEIDKILVDHQGDTACGDNYEYDALLIEIRQAMEGKPERQMGEDNVIEGEGSDWKRVKTNCLDLCSKTHNLEVMISLTQALTHLQGYSGLVEGSALIAGAIEHYWDCLHPQIDPDDNDPMERLNLFAVFTDYRFLIAVQKLELIRTKGIGSANLHDIRKTRKNKDEESANSAKLIEAVFKGCDQNDLEGMFNLLEECTANFERITTLLSQIENVGNVGAPDFKNLLNIINESKIIVGEHLNHPGTSTSKESADIEGGEDQNTSGKQAASSSAFARGIHSRADVIQALGEIEEYFTRNEPGSPIPLLLQRAKGLVDKDFIALMEDLAPDSVQQVGIVLGTKGNPE